MLLKYFFQLFAISFLVKVYWVDSYLRSNRAEEKVISKDRKLHTKYDHHYHHPYNYPDEDSWNLNLDDFPTDIDDDQYADETYHKSFHSHFDDYYKYDDHEPDKFEHGTEADHVYDTFEYDDEYIHNQPYDDNIGSNDWNAALYLDSHVDDDNWNEYASNRLNNDNAFADDDINVAGS